MSGPKIDQAELEEQKRRQLENERRRLIQKIMQAQEVYNAAVFDVRRIMMDIQNDHETEMEMMKQLETMQRTLHAIRLCKKERAADLEQLLQRELPQDTDEILKAAGNIKSQARFIRAAYEESISSLLKRLEVYLGDVNQLNHLEALTKGMDSMEVFINEESLDFEFARKMIEKSSHISASLKDQVSDALDEVIGILCKESITRSDRGAIMRMAGEIVESQHAGDLQMGKVLKEFTLVKEAVVSRMEDFEELYNEYLAYAGLYHKERGKSREMDETSAPKRRNQFSSITALEAAVLEVKQNLKKVHEENYIREQLNEVMEIFGYDMCTGLVLDTQQKGYHYLSPSSDRKTGIHIYMSESRQMMMEIVGMEVKSREEESEINAIAYDSATLTSSERQIAMKEQQTFCDIHPGIVRELRYRGVILNVRMHRPPALQYAKKIVYLSEPSGFMAQGEAEMNENVRVKAQQKKLKMREMKRGV